MKSLFTGKRKFITAPFLFLTALAFFPITIGILLAWLVYKKVGNKKLKISALSVIGILTLFFGSAWVVAMSSPTPPPSTQNQQQSTKDSEVIGVNTSQEPTSTPIPTVQPTSIPTATPTDPNTQIVKVTKIIDGDTIEIEGGKRVRYIGIDTPEVGQNAECYANEATRKNKELVEGQTVRLVKDVSETDRYGRLLRYVYKGDVFINKELVALGYANASSYPPDVKHQTELRESERKAREGNLGLWKSCNQVKATSTPKPTTKPATSNSGTSGTTQRNTQPQTIQQAPQTNTGGFSCNCSKTCSQISSCAEAQYQLKTCGCSARDADGDGVACDGAPLSCQN